MKSYGFTELRRAKGSKSCGFVAPKGTKFGWFVRALMKRGARRVTTDPHMLEGFVVVSAVFAEPQPKAILDKEST
jgi:hypothetical protein